MCNCEFQIIIAAECRKSDRDKALSSIWTYESNTGVIMQCHRSTSWLCGGGAYGRFDLQSSQALHFFAVILGPPYEYMGLDPMIIND